MHFIRHILLHLGRVSGHQESLNVFLANNLHSIKIRGVLRCYAYIHIKCDGFAFFPQMISISEICDQTNLCKLVKPTCRSMPIWMACSVTFIYKRVTQKLHIMQVSHAGPPRSLLNIATFFSPEILEMIGKKLDELGLVGFWNQVLTPVLRTTLPRNVDPGIAMLNTYLLRGEYIEDESENAVHFPEVIRRPAIFHVLRNIVAYNDTHDTPCMSDTELANLFRQIVTCHPSVLMQRDNKGNTPLHYALYHDTISEEVLLALLQNPRDVGQKFDELLMSQNEFGSTPLHFALTHRQCSPSLLGLLVDSNNDVLYMLDRQLQTPLHIFLFYIGSECMYTYLSILAPAHPPERQDILLTCGDDNDCTPLHTIIFQGFHSFDRYGIWLKDLIDTNQEVLCRRTRIDNSLNQKHAVSVFRRNTPLHIAIEAGLDAWFVGMLVDDAQQALRIRNSVDDAGHWVEDTPLHTALRMDANMAIITKLVDRHGRVLRIANYYGDLPLHTHLRTRNEFGQTHRLQNHVTATTAITMIEAYIALSDPAIFLTPGKNGDLPLHTALRNGFGFPVVSYLVESNPAALTVQNESDANCDYKNGDTPLSLAIQEGYSMEVLRILVDAAKTVITIADDNGSIPLHHACKWSATAAPEHACELIKLLRQTADEVDLRNRYGVSRNCALHIYLMCTGISPSPQVVRLLTDSAKHVLSASNENGNTPLHVAVGHKAPDDCIRLLITDRNSPVNALLLQNAMNETPLHVAMQKGYSLSVWSKLIDRAKTVLAVHDDIGGTPLHRYIAGPSLGDCEERVRLLRAGPEAAPDILMVCNEANYTPLHFCLCFDLVDSHQTPDFLKLLIDENQEALLVPLSTSQPSPLHIILTEDRHLSGTPDVFEQKVALLIDKKRTVLFRTDCFHRLPLHIAIENECSIHVVRLLVPPLPIQRLPMFGGVPGLETAKYMREAQAYRQMIMKYGCSLLHLALDRVSDDGLKILQFLSDKFRAPEYNMQHVKDTHGMTPIHKTMSADSVGRNTQDIIKLLSGYQ